MTTNKVGHLGASWAVLGQGSGCGCQAPKLHAKSVSVEKSGMNTGIWGVPRETVGAKEETLGSGGKLRESSVVLVTGTVQEGRARPEMSGGGIREPALEGQCSCPALVWLSLRREGQAGTRDLNSGRTPGTLQLRDAVCGQGPEDDSGREVP